MTRATRSSLALAALAACVLCVLAPAGAEGGALLPRGKKIFFGISDTGDPADFGQFSKDLRKHPALIETFRTWGSDFPESIERWQEARARPVLHFTTADNDDGHELISPRAIAQGYGDEYLIRLNRLFWEKQMRAYLRPLGEPNRCLNVYAAYDCAGNPRDKAHKPRWYKLAFRRMHVILHGGGKRSAIDRRLAEAGVAPLQSELAGLPRAPIAVLWSTLPAGSPTVPQNRPRYFYPGDPYVDWVGTDFYSDNQDWKSLNGMYRRYASKPFSLPEFGVSSGDDPAYMRKLMTWVERHRRCKMLIYYQDFGSTSSYRIQNYPASLAVLSDFLHSPRFPHFAPHPPLAPPPPPGGLAPRDTN
ncbi:MAG TPA: glycosyl hydrolase [Solirubrobacterales bacterium]|nr:glycosyl hydrolase [Solirubrobacterales bacterium]